MIIDNFLPFWGHARKYAEKCKYLNIPNPADGVIYPRIHRLDERIGQTIGALIEHHTNIRPQVHTIFLRQSPKGVPVPNQAHNDASMGEYSLMVYMNTEEQCQGGTALLRHIPSGLEAPNAKQLQSLQKDSNDPTKWEVVSMCQMKPNRAFIFDANLLHRAEPIGGFGSTNKDARVVLTAFFSRWRDPNEGT